MKIDIVTLFPEMFRGPFEESMLKRAQDKRIVSIKIHNVRDWAIDKHGTVDDRPYGGGPGMVMRVDIVDRALKTLKAKGAKVVLLTPQGKVFKQAEARRLAKLNHLIFIAGHYEGIDERIRTHLVDEEVSIGDYVLTGGELPTMVVVDAIVRLLPGVLGKKESLSEESFSSRATLEYPHYTRPEVYRGWKVPQILLSGNHAQIKSWRKEESLKRTKQRRPDLLPD